VNEADEWLTVTDVAERLGVPPTRVQQMLRDGALAGVRQDDGVVRIPADLLAGDSVVKGLGGVLTLLRDAGYSDDEALRWLHTPDDTLPGTPVQALRGERGKEVKRRAQALGF
jgi:excisionase family DNA binding protein